MLPVSVSWFLLPNLSEEWRMPLLVSNQCVRAISFDWLRGIFNHEVSFSVKKGNWMANLLCVIHERLTGSFDLTRNKTTYTV